MNGFKISMSCLLFMFKVLVSDNVKKEYFMFGYSGRYIDLEMRNFFNLVEIVWVVFFFREKDNLFRLL